MKTWKESFARLHSQGLGKLERWLPQRPAGLTVLSLDGHWLKLLQARGTGHARIITALLAKPVEGLSDEALLNWLREACRAQGLEPGSVLVANPTQLTTARIFTLPSTDPKEIRDIVELQAEKHTPYAKEEIVTDFRILETDPTGYARVLLLISHQDVVRRALKLVQGMGWALERVGFELEGLVNWFRALQGGSTQGAPLVVEVDAETTTLMILQHGQPHFHRSLTLGANQLTNEPAEGPARWLAEVQRSLDAFKAEGLNVAIGEVVLTGQIERLPGLKDQLHEQLQLPAKTVAPFEGCALTDRASAAKEARSQVSFASLQGLAVAPSEIDLTPPALKLHRVFEVRARVLVGLGCQLIAGLLLISCLVIGKAQKDERYYAQLTQEHQRTAWEAGELEETLRQLALVKNWLRARAQLLDIMTELSRLSPSVMLWDSLRFTRGEDVVIRGVSEEMPKVFDFVAALEESSLFTQVEARRVTKRREEDQDLTDFEIICSLVLPGMSDE